MRSNRSRIKFAIGLLAIVMTVGIVGYASLGLTWLDAVYMTVLTITTIGFTEITGPEGATAAYKIFTIAMSLVGVATALYTLGLIVQNIVEGQLIDFLGRRRMDRKIAKMTNHVVVCGWGRVGRAAAHDLTTGGRDIVVIDEDENRVRSIPYPAILGDATLDTNLAAAGVGQAYGLIAALEGDAENLFVTLSSKAINPDLFVVARARAEESIAKLSNAGADRIVNPQELGAARMASFIVQPNVAEFVDVIMHERSMDFRMQEIELAPTSRIAGKTLREANLRQYAPVLVLALRDDSGEFTTNPSPETELHAGNIIIVVGTDEAINQLMDLL